MKDKILETTPIRDKNGNKILCDGAWHSPENMNQFLVAVSVLHAANGQDGDYKEACERNNMSYVTYYLILTSF